MFGCALGVLNLAMWTQQTEIVTHLTGIIKLDGSQKVVLELQTWESLDCSTSPPHHPPSLRCTSGNVDRAPFGWSAAGVVARAALRNKTTKH